MKRLILVVLAGLCGFSTSVQARENGVEFHLRRAVGPTVNVVHQNRTIANTNTGIASALDGTVTYKIENNFVGSNIHQIIDSGRHVICYGIGDSPASLNCVKY